MSWSMGHTPNWYIANNQLFGWIITYGFFFLTEACSFGTVLTQLASKYRINLSNSNVGRILHQLNTLVSQLVLVTCYEGTKTYNVSVLTVCSFKLGLIPIVGIKILKIWCILHNITHFV